MSATSSEQTPNTATRQWKLDPTRSTVEFRVRHFWGLITVVGHFDRFEGAYTVGADGPEIELTIDAASLDTGRKARDKHLRSADFFDVAAHPYTRFTSTGVVEAADGDLHVTGELEAAGRRVPLVFDAKLRNAGKEIEIEAATTVDHRLFGMTWSPLGTLRSPSTLHVKARLTGSRS